MRMLLLFVFVVSCKGEPLGTETGVVEDTSVETPEAEPWTTVTVPNAGPYGEMTFEVPAAQNWVNTGLYLRTGQTAVVRASGTWNPLGGDELGPEGKSDEKERGCDLGSFVARMGLHYEDEVLTCVGFESTVTADKDGVLFVGAIVSTDLGESYHTRSVSTGFLTVSVTSEGDTVPTLNAAELASFQGELIPSGWVEVRGEHVLLTLSTATVSQDLSTAKDAIQFLDTVYKSHEVLRGAQPFLGQRVRFFPDATTVGYMLAGNPIRMKPPLTEGSDSQRITRVAEAGTDVWGFTHELGHTFNMVDGKWKYMSNGTLEAWPNIFTLYTLQDMEHPDGQRAYCDGKEAYLAQGTYLDDFKGDPWLNLCLLMELQASYGWELYRDFYVELDARSHDEQPYGDGAWGWTRDRMNDITGEDTTAVFEGWKVPL